MDENVSHTLEYTSFASSSAGNAGVVSYRDTHILLDAGISARKINAGLQWLGLTREDIDAILITHTHSDHIKGLEVLMKKCTAPVLYSGRGFNCGEPFLIGEIGVTPFKTPHDAAGSAGFRFTAGGLSLGFATDLGYMTEEVAAALDGAETVVLESNYDPFMLSCGAYPEMLKRRIASNRGHLANNDAADAAFVLAKNGAKKIALAHLSKENNTPDIALLAVSKRIGEGVELCVLPRDGVLRLCC